MRGLHFHPLRVSRLQRDTEDGLLIDFELPPTQAETFQFEPGQYLTLKLGDDRRSYSLCSAPGEGLRVGVRRVPGGVFSNRLHSALQVGDVVEVLPPQGRFGAALSGRPRHVLAVAGGSGITPLLSILKATLARDAQARCTLIYANRTAASTLFKAELDDLKSRYLTRFALHHVFSREQLDAPLNAGRLDAEKLQQFLRLCGPVDQAFVCGPHAMNDSVEAGLRAAGVRAACIHVERFGVPPDEVGAAAVPLPSVGAAQTDEATVTLVRDGLTRCFSFKPGDDSLLDAAARAGLDLPYACKSGVCATCRCKLVAGQVQMARNFALQADDLAAGFVLACQARPLSAQVAVSFDER